MKKVLIITYYWPPSGGAGVQRWLKFAKYLKELNVQVFILTVDKNYASYPVLDKTLAADVDDSIAVSTTKIWDPNNLYKKLVSKKVPYGTISKKEKQGLGGKVSGYIRSNFFVPDSRMFWHIHATSKALELIKKHDIKTIVTTGPPQSTHLIGLKLKKKINFKWIVDFRDPWTKSFFNDYLDRSKWAVKKDEKLEQKVIEKADEIVIVSEGMKADFVVPLKNVHTIYNGFDEEDFNDIKLEKKQKFTLAYTGNFKDNQNISTVWEVLEELSIENDEFKSNFELVFAGNINESIRADIAKYGFNKSVKYLGYVSHAEAIQCMINSSLLLFTIPKAQYNENIITGKVFEYLASKTPILGIGPVNGKAAEILKNCNREYMIDYENKDLIKAFLLKSFELWQTNGNHKVDNEKHMFYSRMNQTKELAKLI